MTRYRYKTWYGGAGMIILDQNDRMLLVKGTRTNIWSFPKGHPEEEDNDAPLQTAIRETTEETGLQYLQDYTLYSPKPIRTQFGRIYYLAKINPTSIDKPIANKKHSGGTLWYNYKEPPSHIQINTNVKYILTYKYL